MFQLISYCYLTSRNRIPVALFLRAGCPGHLALTDLQKPDEGLRLRHLRLQGRGSDLRNSGGLQVVGLVSSRSWYTI